MSLQIWLVRHGQTAWTLSGAHTGRTDLPLTEAGRENARAAGRWLAGRKFALVLTSPLSRARETCRLAGYGDVAQVDPNLAEWDYGDYEGRTTAEIRKERPDWSLWREGPLNGETVEQVGARAEAMLARIAASYTMARERTVHARLAPLEGGHPGDAASPAAATAEGDLTDMLF